MPAGAVSRAVSWTWRRSSPGSGGFRVVHLEVARQNHAAIALYRAAGYVPLETLRDYYAPGEDGLRMELVLGEAVAQDAG